jgi:hypothetical protein
MAHAHSRHTSRRSASLGCFGWLTIAVLPLLIYVFQLLGKISSAASCVAGMLLVLKVVVELRHARPLPRPRSPRQPSAPLVRRAPQEPLAGCYFCGKIQMLRPYAIDDERRVGACQHCHRTLFLSRENP